MRVWGLGMCGAVLLALLSSVPARAADKGADKGAEHWVGTWATASYPVKNVAGRGATGGPATGAGLGAVAAQDETLREVVHLSLGGSVLRVTLSNAFGAEPLRIGAATVALAAGAPAAVQGAPTALQFGGKATILIPPGAVVVSDPVVMTVAPLADLAINLFLPSQTVSVVTEHNNAVALNERIPGDAALMATMPGAVRFPHYGFLKSVEVTAPADAGAIVAFGDSITDGTYVTPGSNMRWPDELARRLQADKHTRGLAVLNAGIGGNRVLHDGTGPSALARFGADALELPGVRYVIVLEAINDIGHAYQPENPYDVVTAEDLIQGYGQMIARAHERGIKIIGATLTPYVGATYASPAGEAVRSAVNAWIRQPGHFDGVIDFDAATRDPARPEMFSPAVDHGDHLHPGDAGYKVMGDAVDLGLFR